MKITQVYKKIQVYGLGGFIRLVFDITISRLFVSGKIRIIRRPYYIRGWDHIDWGNDLTTGINLRVDAFDYYNKQDKIIRFGNSVEMNDYVHIAAVKKIWIGNNVLIASKVFITDHNHGSYKNDDLMDSPLSKPNTRTLYCEEVVIEDNVWIGEFVSILPGVTIGTGSIIGSMSVVSKSIPPYCIAVGAPCRVIKKFDFDTNKWIKIV